MTDDKKPVKRDLSHDRQVQAEQADAKVLAVVRQFVVALRRQIIVTGVLLVLAMLPWSLANNYLVDFVPQTEKIMGAGFLIVGFYVFWHWVGWYYSVYVLTTKNLTIITQRGFFNRKVSDMELNNIQSVNYHIRGFSASVFNFGDVEVQTLSGSGDMDLKFVHKPAVLSKQIIDAVHAHGSTSDRVS